LAAEFGVSADALDEIDHQCQATVEAAVRFAIESPEPTGRTALEHVFAERGTAG
jgi:TPP-dependent pyruvate/acetoin dehydrogenase alpha subunit